jgi:hypothetical protein
MTGRLIAVVRAALSKRDRRHEPAAKVTERSAQSDLYGWPRSIDVAPRTPPPLTTHAPSSVAEPGGARGEYEQEFERESTEST